MRPSSHPRAPTASHCGCMWPQPCLTRLTCLGKAWHLAGWKVRGHPEVTGITKPGQAARPGEEKGQWRRWHDACSQAACAEYPSAQCREALAEPAGGGGHRLGCALWRHMKPGRRAGEKGGRGSDARPSGHRPGGGRRVEKGLAGRGQSVGGRPL